MARKKVIYIHGFNSSPLSAKAQLIGQYLSQFNLEYQVPLLSHEPLQALVTLEHMLDSNTVLIGSSLGGYFATYLSQKYQLPAVLVNPAVAPFLLMKDFLGPQYNPYQNYHYQLTMQHVEQLKSLYLPDLPHPQLLWLLQQSADEVLDFQQAVKYYNNCRQVLEFGGDHSFIGFERYFSQIVQFLKIT
ncbi:YqiA/YcfP family alpha/beta fold hydrolase [Pseudoalteromonas tunicata]|uniref:YqiA/YcfP family alpha/beta fold hydrolase n=1 Tax=Pseudoalteromonas tunicata TaxID=314281 RepID=UPI0027402239|nr:YqiA/YcfP family alpha/beta fold hydrolase [Pseudoalteromonas tunicata]MDP4983022.1 esterase YqiA [Pseudoalteromonas tunicata]MDP5211837.1 esterase YqiA [Pseudoalteromonas tunicata]